MLRDVPLTHVYPYLNLQMLLGKHLGLRGSVARLLAEGDAAARELHAQLLALEQEAHLEGLIRADGLYRFYRAASAGDDLVLFEGGREVARFRFPRQPGGERLCLADYVREAASGEPDYVALFAVTCGAGVRELAERWKQEGQYLRSHLLQALAIECAEAFAEMLHARLRTQWGFPDPPGLAMSDRLKARYQGIRVSFGYPACPNLADQRILFDLLRPEQIGLDPHRGLHDGPGGLGVRPGVPPSRGEVLQGRRRGRRRVTLAVTAPGVSPRFLGLLAEEGLAGKRVLDVGCGWGRLALALAPGGRITWWASSGTPALVAEARRRAGAAGLANVGVPRGRRRDHRVHALGARSRHGPPLRLRCHHRARASRALPDGACLGMVAFHVDQWRETGRVSRFAYDEARMERALRAAGLVPRPSRSSATCRSSARSRRRSAPPSGSRTAGGRTGAGSGTSRSSSRAGAR